MTRVPKAAKSKGETDLVKILGRDYLEERMVPVDELAVDHSYQRPEKPLANKIGKNYLPGLGGTILVGQRPDGSLWIADGQQRWIGAKMSGFEHIKCRIFESSGPEDEAKVFLAENLDRLAVNVAERFDAKLIAKIPEALEIRNIFNKSGFELYLKVTRKRVWPRIGCVGRVESIYKKHGPDILRDGLIMIKTLWSGESRACGEDYLIAACEFINNYREDPNFDMKVLAKKLSTVSCAALDRSADNEVHTMSGLSKSGWGRGRGLTQVLSILYNKDRLVKHRIPLYYRLQPPRDPIQLNP